MNGFGLFFMGSIMNVGRAAGDAGGTSRKCKIRSRPSCGLLQKGEEKMKKK